MCAPAAAPNVDAHHCTRCPTPRVRGYDDPVAIRMPLACARCRPVCSLVASLHPTLHAAARRVAGNKGCAPATSQASAMLTTKVVREIQAFGAGRLSWVCDAGLTCAVSRSVQQAGTTRESQPSFQPPMPSSTWPRREARAFKRVSRRFLRSLHSTSVARVLESLQKIELRPSEP